MRGLALATLVLLAACSLEPGYQRPESPVPPSWPTGDAYLRQTESDLPSLGYRELFRDPRLQQLVSEALETNRDLRVALANVAVARATYRIQRAQQFPQLNASTSATILGGDGSTTGSGSTSADDPRASFSAELGITSFEIDLFGRLRALSRAEQNRWLATEAAARTARLALVGDIANAWLSYGANASLLSIADETARSAGRSVELTRLRYQGGIAPRSDLSQAEQVLATAQADLAEQRTLLAQDVNALQLLVGRPIAADLLPRSIDDAAERIAAPPAGLDSRILLRRPDIVQAEYELRAANAEIGAARAALFPTISLTGVAGFASNALSSLFSGGAFSYSAGIGADYPIFRAGAGRAGVDLSIARRDALLATYDGAIQTAFREVADALARQGTVAGQERATRALTDAAADTYRLAEARYRGGIEPFLDTLDAQRSFYQAQRSLIAIRLVAASNRVALYRALGGDPDFPAAPQ
jgi:multidrug efflux system outer membrane protein